MRRRRAGAARRASASPGSSRSGLRPAPGSRACSPQMLGTLLVTALGAWLVARFEQVAEIRIAVVGSARTGPRPRAASSSGTVGGYRVVGWVDRGSRVLGRRRPLSRCPLGRIGEIVARDAHRPGRRRRPTRRGRRASPTSCVGLDVRLIGLNRLYEDVIGHVPLATLDAAFFQYLMHPRYRGGSRVAKRATDLVVGGAGRDRCSRPVVGRGRAGAAPARAGPAFERRPLRRRRRPGVRPSLPDCRAGSRLARSAPMLLNVLRGADDARRPARRIAPAELARPSSPGSPAGRSCGSRVGGGRRTRAGRSRHDLYYLKHRSTTLDTMILLQTLVTVGQGLRLPEPAADEALAQAN